MILTNCDLNMYSHISYKSQIVTIGPKKRKNLTKQFFYARVKVSIDSIFYMDYSKLYYALLDLKKVVISICFNVMIYIEFELLN